MVRVLTEEESRESADRAWEKLINRKAIIFTGNSKGSFDSHDYFVSGSLGQYLLVTEIKGIKTLIDLFEGKRDAYPWIEVKRTDFQFVSIKI